MSDLIKDIVEKEYRSTVADYPAFAAGDTVIVHCWIREGEKKRIQQFEGTVIQIRNKGGNGETFTVRKISNGVGVERIFPMLSPNIDKIQVIRRGKVKRARLFYLRGRKGKSAKVKERRLK